MPGHSVLALRSHGREVEFGQHLTEEQRHAVAQTLRQQLAIVDIKHLKEHAVGETMIRRIAQTLACLSLLLSASGIALAEMRLNLQDPQTIVAHEIYDLHNVILVDLRDHLHRGVRRHVLIAICKHRKSVGHKAEQFHENTTVEILWTVIPFLILIGMAYPRPRRCSR